MQIQKWHKYLRRIQIKMQNRNKTLLISMCIMQQQTKNLSKHKAILTGVNFCAD